LQFINHDAKQILNSAPQPAIEIGSAWRAQRNKNAHLPGNAAQMRHTRQAYFVEKWLLKSSTII